MKKKCASILLTFICLLGLSGAAKAEIRGQIRVTLPFKFVVDGKTLPAGTYKVSHLTDGNSGPLILTSRDNGTSVFVKPTEMEDASAYKPNVSFSKVGDQHFLSGIQTADYVYNFSASRSVTLAAAVKPHDTVPVSGSGGSN